MSVTQKKAVLLWSGIAGSVMVFVGVWFYAQWNQTQTLYSQETLPETKEEVMVPEQVQQADQVSAPPSAQDTPVTQVPTPEPVSERVPGKSDTALEAAALEQEAIQALLEQESKFTQTLEALYAQGKQDFLALPQDQQTQEQKERFAMDYGVQGAILETQCDAVVSEILANLSMQLERLGEDTGVVAEMRTAYITKKAEQKEYYMALYSQY